MSSAVVSQAGQILREMFKIPARAREQVGTTWRSLRQTGSSPANDLSLVPYFKPARLTVTCVFETEKPKKELLQTSLAIHRPIWITGVAGTYTTAYACYLTMRYMRKFKR